MKDYLSHLTSETPWGVCPFCGYALGWSSDEPSVEDDNVTVRYLHCSNCGAEIEAQECSSEERHAYPYWQDAT